MEITAPPNELFTLDDNLFGDITFEYFYGINIKKIGSNVFNKTADKIKTFICADCPLEHQPPKYNLQTIFNQMSQLILLSIELNIPDEIVLNSILPNGKHSNLEQIHIKAHELTIKSGAFQPFEKLNFIIFEAVINVIEKDAFKLDSKLKSYLDSNDETFHINFNSCKFTNGSLQNGSFDEIQKPIEIAFNSMNVSSLPEEAFKFVLNNEKNIINFETSKIDCSDCKNYWLIKGKAACQNSLCSLPCIVLIQLIIMLLFALYLYLQVIITSVKMIIR